jgi:hypothetical protein
VEYIPQVWSHSKAYRLILIITLIYVALRMAVQAVYLLGLLPGQPVEYPIPVDLQAYLDAAQRLLLHQDLYPHGPLKVLELLYQYPPFFALAFVPFLWMPPLAAAIVHTLLHIGAYVLLYVWWSRILSRQGFDRASQLMAWLLPLWLVFSAFWSDLGYLNVYIITALLATLLTEAILAERLGWSVLWLWAILQMKPFWAFAIVIPLLLGQYRFFFKLVLWTIIINMATVAVTLLALGPAYGWQQHLDYVQLLRKLSEWFPWRGPKSPFLGYNHSIVQTVVFLLGVTPATLRLATFIKLLLLAPLGIVGVRRLLHPAGRNMQVGLDFAFALYMGAFIWLDMVWEVSLGIAVFTYLLATLEPRQRIARGVMWVLFFPYAVLDFWQLFSYAVFGLNVIYGGTYILTDPTIYVPLIMAIILVFYALLVRRLWNTAPVLTRIEAPQ